VQTLPLSALCTLLLFSVPEASTSAEPPAATDDPTIRWIELDLCGTFSPQKDVLSFFSTNLSDDQLASLPVLPEVKTLNLSLTNITDTGLSALGRFPNLQKLYLGHTVVSNAGLCHLRALPITVLDLSDTMVCPEGIVQFLCSQDTLVTLIVSPRDVTDALVRGLLECHKLHVLSIAQKPIAQFVRCNAKAPTPKPNPPDDDAKITDLDLSMSRITNDSLKVLGSLARLQYLNLGATAITDDGITDLQGLVALKGLSLRGTRATTGKCLDKISRLPRVGQLAALDLSGIAIPLQGCYSDSPAYNASIAALFKKLSNLKLLWLNGCAVEDGTIINNIKALANLTVLDVSNNGQITDLLLQTLADDRTPSTTEDRLNDVLRRLDISISILARKITTSVKPGLSTKPSRLLVALTSIDVSGTGITEVGVHNLQLARVNLIISRTLLSSLSSK
jgi:hypothetical protein